MMVLFGIVTIGVCSLPVALATADALARRGDPAKVFSKGDRIVLLAFGGAVVILVALGVLKFFP